MAFAALFDPLYCPEEHLDLYHEEPDWPPPPRQRLPHDELPAQFEALRGKEAAAAASQGAVTGPEDDGYGGTATREAAVGWASRAVARLGFSALTAALAAAYLDRCFLGVALRLGGGQPWTVRLAAVACVALAANVEETRMPALVDLQLFSAAGDEGDADPYVFEAKTVRRMELLVLSALGWRMHLVTPFSYLEPLLADAAARRGHCERVLIAVVPDLRWPRHRPSAWAAAALLATASSADDDSELLALINASEDEVAECAKAISEATGMCFLAGVGTHINNKRKAYSPPPSPSGVIGALSGFSCETSSSSVDSRAPATAAAPVSASSSPERPGKRARAASLLPPDEENRDAWPSSTCAA